jgi:DNA-directed RNA polymerase specialized sigma24 family protein
MKTHSNLTEEQFQRLIAWLGPDADAAGERYEFIRQGLIIFFVNRRCLDAEDLADETINRVAEKLEWLADSYEGDPERYFYGVAKNVSLEYGRRKRLPANATRPPTPPDPLTEAYYACLDACLGRLTQENRELILAYYAAMTRKAGARRKLREQLSIKAGALRARTFRVRSMLEKCVRDCMAGYTET